MLFTLAAARAAGLATILYVPATMELPVVPREFRAAWVASVGNIDWPSQPGLPVAQQKTELLNILNRAVELHLNAIILQVRPACDALYASKLEPWSYYLTGEMGKAPQPLYDPLAFAVAEAHQRGLELHAWFNPYRVALLAQPQSFSKNSVKQTHPDWVRRYGSVLWLDPGEKDVQEYSLRVVMDVVKRYDIDAVQFDDYFYPYQEKKLDFPDAASWRKYGAGGKLSREDWRRENVNTFVRRTYESIKAAKPWVKFGIAPFGIWEPGFPAQIKGMNAYATLYADSRKWLTNGWVDYWTPQLYWAIDPPETSFPALLEWWNRQNPKHRNIWPGLYSEAVASGSSAANTKNWLPREILNQIKLTRELSGGTPGEVFFSMKSLLQNRAGLAADLAKGVFAEPALIPQSPWLEDNFPAQPKLKVGANASLTWSATGAQPIAWWVLQTRLQDHWRTFILPGDTHEQSLESWPDAVALTAIDRCGMASVATLLQQASGREATQAR